MEKKNDLNNPIFQMNVKTKKTFGWRDRGFYLFSEGYKLTEIKDGKPDLKKEIKFYPLKDSQIIQEPDPSEISILHNNSKHKFIKFQNQKEKEIFLFQVNTVTYEIAKKNAYSLDYYLKEEEIEKLNTTPDCDNNSKLIWHFQNLLTELNSKISELEKYMSTIEFKELQMKMKGFSICTSFKCIKDELVKQFERIIGIFINERKKIQNKRIITETYNAKDKKENNSKEKDEEREKSKSVSHHLDKEDIINILNKEKKEEKKKDEEIVKESEYIVKDDKKEKTEEKIENANKVEVSNVNVNNTTQQIEKKVNILPVYDKPIIRRKQLKSKIKYEHRKFEPLSMLQRQCEKFIYSSMLTEAKKEKVNKGIRLAYIAAFYIGSLSLNINRLFQPFNPLLGETYEYTEKSNNNFRYLAEQVSYEPSICAFIGENDYWSLYGDTRAKGKLHLIFKGEKGHYLISQPSSMKGGIMELVSKSDYKGSISISDMEDKAFTLKLKFNEDVSSNLRGAFEGFIQENNVKKYIIKGNLESYAYYCDRDGKNKRNIWQIIDDKYLSNNSDLEVYNIPSWSYELNNIQPEIHDGLPPTDSRFRPDIRKSEEGDFDTEQEIRIKLELRRKNRLKEEYEESQILYQPNYFNEVFDQYTGDYVFTYKGDYWEDRGENNFSHLDEEFYSY